MYRIFLLLFFTTLLNVQPSFSQNTDLNVSIGTSFKTKNMLGLYDNLRSQNKSKINFDLELSKKYISSQLSLNFDDRNNINYDNSYFNYENGIANFSIGKIDRIWSFSKKSSLILSSNSRPLEAISVNLKNKFNTQWLSSSAYWSIEIINGSTKSSYKNKNSMLSGTRITISPSQRLNFELIQTGQWGDKTDKLYS